MINKIIKHKFKHLLSQADITIDGGRDWDLQVHNNSLYPQVLVQGSLALGETYMQGWWDVPNLDEFFCRVYSSQLQKQHRGIPNGIAKLRAFLINQQTQHRAKKVGEEHYDIGNDLYQGMLDKRMIYSCGYWKDADNLDDAQEAKLELICQKLQLKPGMRVLDIGCGWGGTAKYMAENYGVDVVGITISQEQALLAEQVCEGLPIEIRVQDYRRIHERFDRIVSVGMFEHVGSKNYQTYMEIARNQLPEDGLFLLHTIGRNETNPIMDPWLTRYIFPNSMLPSPEQITAAANGVMVLEDWHNFGSDYDKTLMAWHDNFIAHWPNIKDNYSDTFYRMWVYYLMASTAAFRARHLQLWQVVLSPKGIPGGYQSVR